MRFLSAQIFQIRTCTFVMVNISLMITSPGCDIMDDGARDVSNSSMWSRLLLLRRSIVA